MVPPERENQEKIMKNDDLISRKYLLEAYDREHVGPPGRARELIANAPTEMGWIPCEERMPEEKPARPIMQKLGVSTESDTVLVTIEINGCRIVDRAYIRDGQWEWHLKIAYPGYKVVAWMPYPEPYREGGE